MKMHQLKLWSQVGFITSALFFGSSVRAETNHAADAVNQSAYQGVVIQQMLMGFAKVGMNLKPEKSEKNLHQAISRFDGQLSDLLNAGAENPSITALKEVKSLWDSVKQKLSSIPEKAAVQPLFKDLEKLLDLSDQAANQMINNAGMENSDIFILAARQRMLSQRMAALYMLMAWRLESDDYAVKFKQTVAEFRSNHLKLKESVAANPEIGTKLESVDKVLIWFDKAAESTSGKYVPTIIQRSANKILNIQDDVAKKYAGL